MEQQARPSQLVSGGMTDRFSAFGLDSCEILLHPGQALLFLVASACRMT
jgi:hypothetical protein